MRRIALDAATQRIYIYSVWAVFQAFKFYNLLRTARPGTNAIAWSLIDATVLLGVSRLQLSGFRLNSAIILVLISGIISVNTAVSYRECTVNTLNAALVVASQGMGFCFSCDTKCKGLWNRGSLALREKFVDVNKLLDYDKIIQGRRVINVLPDR
jgi:hypothetical protein